MSKPVQKFGVGDKMYHPIHGKVQIRSFDPSPQCISRYWIEKLSETGNTTWVQEELLSYVAWPKPVTEPPLQVGLYAINMVGYPFPLIYHYNGENWSGNGGLVSLSRMKEKAKGMMFLGEELKYEQI